MLNRRVDVAILQDPPTLDELDIEPVITERLGLVSGVRTTILDGSDPVRVRQLAGLKLILPDPRNRIRRLVESAAFRRGIVLDQVQQADGLTLIIEMVRNGPGCTVLPFAAVRDEVMRGSLSFRPIEHDPLVTVHAIATRGGDAKAPFIAEFRRLLRDTMSDLAKSGVWAGATTLGNPARSVEAADASGEGGRHRVIFRPHGRVEAWSACIYADTDSVL